MKYRMILNCFVLILWLTGCTPVLIPNFTGGSGQVVSENRTVSHFRAVTLAGLGDLIITQGETEALTITAEENVLPHITSVVQDGVLRLGFDRENWPNWVQPTQPIKFSLTLKTFEALTQEGQGNIEATNIKTPGLTLTLAGQGDIRIAQLETGALTCLLTGKGNINLPNLKATQSDCRVTGQGKLELTGQLTNQAITITGQGDYRAGDLNSAEAKVVINGMGNVTVWVQKRLTIEAFGQGNISYYGSPLVFKNVVGAADVRALGNK